MGVEIERKFLVNDPSWRQSASSGMSFRQGYLCLDPERTVRVRCEGTQGKLTIKGKSRGISRLEFEYDIPFADAEVMLRALCLGSVIEKTRYQVTFKSHTWEIDVFAGDNTGLVVAELELQHEDEPFATPPWLGEEVSDNPRYLNANLAVTPYQRWRVS